MAISYTYGFDYKHWDLTYWVLYVGVHEYFTLQTLSLDLLTKAMNWINIRYREINKTFYCIQSYRRAVDKLLLCYVLLKW